MVDLFDAFVSSHFDPVFSNTAVASWAEKAARLDVETYHARARNAVKTVVAAARDNLDPPMRVVLIKGDAGLGKTHAVISTLWQLSHENKAYPVVMQLSTQVEPEDVS